MERVPLFHPIKVVDIELSQPLVDFEELEGYMALKALVRLHGAPLGYVQVGITNGRCPAAELGQLILEQHGWQIIRHLVADGLATPLDQNGFCLSDLPLVKHPEFNGPFPLVTVAVCTRDRAADLALCLEALLRLDYPALELLIIDNAPATEATKALVESRYPQVRYVREPRPGLSWARNRAILEAQGEIIAFTDDDVLVDPGWVKALAQVFVESPEVMGVTGLVTAYELETEAQILFECHGGFSRGFDRHWFRVNPHQPEDIHHYLGTGYFGTGANMAYRRRLFELIGFFDPALGVGTVTQGGEDIEMFFRLLQNGHALVYEPNALVYHRHRRDFESLRKQLTSNGIGLAAYHTRSMWLYPHLRRAFLRLHLWWLREWHLKRLFRVLTRPYHFPRDLVIGELKGYLLGVGRYFKSRRAAEAITRQWGPLAATLPAQPQPAIVAIRPAELHPEAQIEQIAA